MKRYPENEKYAKMMKIGAALPPCDEVTWMGERAYAVQLYSVRKSFGKDVYKTLERVAEIGYKGVEFFGGFSHDPEELKAVLNRNGLALVGWHVGMDAYDDVNFEKTVAYFKAVGNKRGIIPMVEDEWFNSPEAAAGFGKRLSEIAQKLSAHGLETGYHNHSKEFVPFENGVTPWEVIMDNSHACVIAQLDNGNALSSGTPNLDLCEMVGKYAGRAKVVHLKPYSTEKRFGAMIGADDCNWPKYIDAAWEKGGAEWMIVEYEDDEAYEEFEAIRLCLRALEAIGK